MTENRPLPSTWPETSSIVSHSPDETEAAGAALGRTLKSGAVVTLKGGLGAGKTCFTRGLLRALGVTGAVTSPTYTIINEYQVKTAEGGALTLYHIDAYRLRDAGDFAGIGGDELLGGEGICIIEWPERIADALPAGTIEVVITIRDDGERELIASRYPVSAVPLSQQETSA
jgi:tRNA threonylcarbamoyladenosine biosynthesis protein TsaE